MNEQSGGQTPEYGGELIDSPGATTAGGGRRPTLDGAAWGLFIAHLSLIAFSTAAMLTILNRPPGPWLNAEPAATVMRVAWRFSGPAYVSLGALTAAVFLAGRLGARRAGLLFVVGAGISLGVELGGTSWGLPFGEYHYSGLLGYRVLGRVPFPIPISWFYMLAGSLTIVARIARNRGDDSAARWRWALLAALALVAWDIAMDPAMVRTGHWAWGEGQRFRESALPLPVVAFFTRDLFYGMPLSNWLGWLLTATLIARAMLWIVAPSEWTARVGASRLPVLLYLTNGIMPVALCLRDRLWWAAGLGAAAMLVPAAIALVTLTPSLLARSPLSAQRSLV